MPPDDSQSAGDLVSKSLDRAVTLWGTRIAPALVAPLGILVTIPLLVAGVGLVIGWGGYVAVVESVDTMARRQFRDRAEQGAQHAHDLLGQAEPLTDDMVSYVRRVGLSPPVEDFALRFRDLLRASPGVAYISFGTHEGNYFGVYVDEDRGYRMTHRVYHGPGKTHRRDYLVGDDDALTLIDEDPQHGFDPRVRPWWSASVRNGRRTWSEPYVWFDIGVVGITRSEPIFDDDGSVLAVTTVDFHLNGLSEFVEGLRTEEGGRTFVFTDAHEVIAFPGARQDFGQGEAQGEKLRVEDIDDSAVRALFAALAAGDGQSTEELSFDDDGSGHLAVLRPIRLGEDGHWFVATFGPTEPLTAPAAAHRRNAVIASAVALVIAILVAAFFARFIVRTHVQMRRAEDRARDADARAERLGSYRLTRKLDEGGMGEVWIATHAMLARPAAIKLIRPKYLEDRSAADQRTAVERFRREARTIASLRSRYTVGIYDFGVADDGALFYVMELLDGIDLSALVRKHGALPPRRAVPILIHAARSLREAHAHGVVHRDVKPANIILCREVDELDVAKVLDFGVARQTGPTNTEQTVVGSLKGTPSCMSPEQAHDAQDIDGRADIYSLGCVAYWLLAGRNVFERDSAMAMIMAHVSSAPESLANVAPGAIPPALETVVMRCLAKDRVDRPADMGALADMLLAVQAELPEDGWNELACRAWWAALPPRLEEAGEPLDKSLHLSPKRGDVT